MKRVRRIPGVEKADPRGVSGVMSVLRRAYLIGPTLLFAAGCMPAGQPVGTKSPAPKPATAGVESAPTEPASGGEAALVEAYKAALGRKDVEGILALFWFGNADDEMRQTVRENVEGEMDCPLVDFKIEPVQPGKYGPTAEGGIHWRPSLEVVALLTANFDTKSA